MDEEQEYQLLIQVDEHGIILLVPGAAFRIIEIPYPMWDALVEHVKWHRLEVQKALTGGTVLITPIFEEISLKDFPKDK